MKVLAKIQSGTFLCEVSDHELRKFMRTFGNFGMGVGEEIDLAKGYDFASDAIGAMKKTNEFISSNKEVIKTVFEGIKVASSINEGEFIDQNECIHDLKMSLKYAIEEAEGWRDECHGTDIDDERMVIAKKLLENSGNG